MPGVKQLLINIERSSKGCVKLGYYPLSPMRSLFEENGDKEFMMNSSSFKMAF
jgi:hypothetical protein